MDKISEEMKTEKDFIEKMEASSVNKEAIPTKSEADIERENLKMEMMIKSKEESKDVVSEEKEDIPRVTIDDLKASPVTSEALHNLSKDAKITNTEPEIKNIEIKITAKRPTDDAPWDIQQETTVVEKEPEPVVEEIKKEELPKKEIKKHKPQVITKPKE